MSDEKRKKLYTPTYKQNAGIMPL